VVLAPPAVPAGAGGRKGRPYGTRGTTVAAGEATGCSRGWCAGDRMGDRMGSVLKSCIILREPAVPRSRITTYQCPA